jgi:hypothetical protein
MEPTKRLQIDITHNCNINKKQKLGKESKIFVVTFNNLLHLLFSNNNQFNQVSYLKSILSFNSYLSFHLDLFSNI